MKCKSRKIITFCKLEIAKYRVFNAMFFMYMETGVL